MLCCKTGHALKKWVLSYIYPKEPFVYQSSYGDITIYGSISLDESIRKYKICNDNLIDNDIQDILHSNVEAPWLWIGASSIFGIVDMTSSLNQFLVRGNHITSEILSKCYPYHWNWKYLDPVTLKEVDFPEDGITIDATRVEGLTEESQEVETSG